MASGNPGHDALLLRALERIEELEGRLSDGGGRQREPIAIIGMGCRFPGADGPDAYWQMLVDGVDAIGEVPADRWDIDAYYDPDPATPGKMSTRFGGFVGRVADFDADVLRALAARDRQPRPAAAAAARGGVGGLRARRHPAARGPVAHRCVRRHQQRRLPGCAGRAGREAIDGYFSSGGTASTASGRLSYFFGLDGALRVAGHRLLVVRRGGAPRGREPAQRRRATSPSSAGST